MESPNYSSALGANFFPFLPDYVNSLESAIQKPITAPVEYQPHAYEQRATLESIYTALTQGTLRIGIDKPTASGKSIDIINILRALPQGCKVLFVTGRKRLANSAASLFKRELPTLRVAGSDMRNPNFDIACVTYGYFTQNRRKFSSCHVFIADEVHMALGEKTYFAISSISPVSLLLGFTATYDTPSSSRHERKTHDLTQRAAHKLSFAKAVNQGIICTPTIEEVKVRIVRDNRKTGYQSLTEYHRQELYQFIARRIVADSTNLDNCREDLSDFKFEQAVFFGSTIRHIVSVQHAIQSEISRIWDSRFNTTLPALLASFVDCIHSELPPLAGERVIQRLQEKKLCFIGSCGVISVGFDYPGFDRAYICRNVFSMTKLVQEVGRVLRTRPDRTTASITQFIVTNIGNYSPGKRYSDFAGKKFFISSVTKYPNITISSGGTESMHAKPYAEQVTSFACAHPWDKLTWETPLGFWFDRYFPEYSHLNSIEIVGQLLDWVKREYSFRLPPFVADDLLAGKDPNAVLKPFLPISKSLLTSTPSMRGKRTSFNTASSEATNHYIQYMLQYHNLHDILLKEIEDKKNNNH